MALFGKDDRPQRPDEMRTFAANPPLSPSERIAGDEPVQARLGKGSRVEGKLTFEGSVLIEGQVEGEIEAQETVIVGETAVISAQINAATVVVKGKVTGDISARKRVELSAPGKLLGNITTPSLVIHEGVVFEGHCSMGGSAESKLEKTDKKVAHFPKEERNNSVRLPTEAVK